MKRYIIVSSILILASITCAYAGNPVSPLGTFTNQTDGTVVYASLWNSSIGGIWNWVANTLLPQLNVVQNRGDIYVHNGATLGALPIGGNGTVLVSNSAASLGMAWQAISASILPLINKGDILGCQAGATLTRIPVGTDGTVLTSDSTNANGISWQSPPAQLPGAIMMYWPPYGGAIPSGYVICDGTNGTPNLIGMFPLGATYTGAGPANVNGFGNIAVNSLNGAPSHSHSFSVTANTSLPSGFMAAAYNIGPYYATAYHTHQVTVTGNTATATNCPASLGVVFIMKL